MRVFAVILLAFAVVSTAVAQEKPPHPGIVGIQLGAGGDIRAVIGVMPNTPAAAAGIQAGDYILTVDGVNVATFDREDLVNAISGEPGTQVVLALQRAGSDKREHLVLTRVPVEDYLPKVK